MTEPQLTRKLCALFRRCNAEVFVCSAGNVKQTGGWPDRYVAHAYFQGWIEFKGRRGKLSVQQRKVLRALSTAGVVGRFMSDDFIQFETVDGDPILGWGLLGGWTPQNAADMLKELGRCQKKQRS